MNKTRLIASSLIVSALLSSCASNEVAIGRYAPLGTLMTSEGIVLTDPNGMTLYTYKDDPDGRSVCYKRCARKWTPMRAEPNAKPNGKLTIIERTDGLRQYAFNGRPLYGYHDDNKPSDITGHNKGRVWFLARPWF